MERRLLVLLGILIALSALTVDVRAAVSDGVTYLENNQSGDGSWMGDREDNITSTAFSLIGLIDAGEPASDSYIQDAITYLKNNQSADGGWRSRSLSNNSVTALAVTALATAESTGTEISNGIGYLQTNQNGDGSWGGDREHNVTATALALLAICDNHDAHSKFAKNGIQYLISKQSGSGNWPSKIFSNVTSTALVIQALKACEVADSASEVSEAKNFLLTTSSLWSVDHWYGDREHDHVATAFAIMALNVSGSTNSRKETAAAWLLSNQSDDGSWASKILSNESVTGIGIMDELKAKQTPITYLATNATDTGFFYKEIEKETPLNITAWASNDSLATTIYTNFTGSMQNITANVTGTNYNLTDTSNLAVGFYHIGANTTAAGNWSSNATLANQTVVVWSNATITIFLNGSRFLWGDPVNISGNVIRDDSTIMSSGAVNITVFGTRVCSMLTTDAGWYSCAFNAPRQVGRFGVLVEVRDPSTWKLLRNTTILFVEGELGAGLAERERARNVGCYEEPRLIQNEDGTIEVAIVRVCVWK